MKKIPPAATYQALAATMARAIFGGLKLSREGMHYVRAAQVHFGVLEVESALDGRDLFVKERFQS